MFFPVFTDLPYLTSLWRHMKSFVFISVDMDRVDQDLYIGTKYSIIYLIIENLMHLIFYLYSYVSTVCGSVSYHIRNIEKYENILIMIQVTQLLEHWYFLGLIIVIHLKTALPQKSPSAPRHTK